MRPEDYLKQYRDLYGTMVAQYTDLIPRHPAYDETLLAQQKIQEQYGGSSLAREARRYLYSQQQVMRYIRPMIAEVYATSLISSIYAQPLQGLLGQRRALMSQFEIPPTFRAAMETIGGYESQVGLYTADVERLLKMLGPYAGDEPALPDEAALTAVRQHVAEIMSANASKVSTAFAELLQWLSFNAPTIGRAEVKFFLIAMVYPLFLTVYQDDLKQVYHQAGTAKGKVIERSVVAAVRGRVPAEALFYARYVSKPTLNVRSASRRNSTKVGELHFGDVVVVVRETKDWTLIEWNADDADVRGWVLKRGLRRFGVKH